MDMGIEQYDASLLISAIGISDMIGRFVLGWLSDHHLINRIYIYGIIVGVCGLSEWNKGKYLSLK